MFVEKHPGGKAVLEKDSKFAFTDALVVPTIHAEKSICKVMVPPTVCHFYSRFSREFLVVHGIVLTDYSLNKTLKIKMHVEERTGHRYRQADTNAKHVKRLMHTLNVDEVGSTRSGSRTYDFNSTERVATIIF